MITNRSITDVTSAASIRAKYQALGDWQGLTDIEREQLERGTYTIVSLNRVEVFLQALSDELYQMGYVANVTTKTDWKYTDYFTESEKDRYLANVAEIRRIITVWGITPQTPPDISPYVYANDIEKILVDIELVATRIKETVNAAWTISTAHTGLFAKQTAAPPTPTLYILTEGGDFIADDNGNLINLLQLPKNNDIIGTIIIGDGTSTYRTEVQ